MSRPRAQDNQNRGVPPAPPMANQNNESNIMKNIKVGQKYKLRNGATAEVIGIDDPGIRPVRATIYESGEPVYSRWFTAEGREYASVSRNQTPEESPFDFLGLVEGQDSSE